METNYYEAYNQDNVRLVDLFTTPIERITEDSVKTTEEDIKCDILVYATGFSASKSDETVGRESITNSLCSHWIFRCY